MYKSASYRTCFPKKKRSNFHNGVTVVCHLLSDLLLRAIPSCSDENCILVGGRLAVSPHSN